MVMVMNETSGSIKGGKFLAGQGKNEHGRCGLNTTRCTPSLSTLYIFLPAPLRDRGIAPRVFNLSTR